MFEKYVWRSETGTKKDEPVIKRDKKKFTTRVVTWWIHYTTVETARVTHVKSRASPIVSGNVTSPDFYQLSQGSPVVWGGNYEDYIRFLFSQLFGPVNRRKGCQKSGDLNWKGWVPSLDYHDQWYFQKPDFLLWTIDKVISTKGMHICGCRSNERLKVKTDGSTHLRRVHWVSPGTGSLKHLKIGTRLMINDESFGCVMCEFVDPVLYYVIYVGVGERKTKIRRYVYYNG